MLFLLYELLLVTAGFAIKIFGDLRARWVERTVAALDRRLLWLVSGVERRYLRQLHASVQDMETVGIATPGEFVLQMRQVYVDVSLTPQALHAAAGEPYLGTVPGPEAAAEPGRRRSLESVLRDAERGEAARVLAVIGGPGSGKTTLARNTALALCGRRWHLRRRKLPVLLYLRDHAQALLADDPPELGAVAVSATWLEGKVPADWLQHRLGRGRCVVLLDGLDEVADPADRGRVVAWVIRQSERHPGNIYVVTSRPHGYLSNPLPKAEVLQVRRFTGEQIERFLHQWSLAVESRARDGGGREAQAAAHRSTADLLARLRARPALYDLAANPLLLTMTANVHRYRGQLPGSRAELYAEMCDVLMHRRSEVRGLSNATGLSGPHKQHIVQHLALAMMKAKVRDWPVREATKAIRRALEQVPGNVTPEVFLEEARKSGLLVEREHGVYGFAHLTLQEYLAAAQLSTPRARTAILTGSVDDPWWRETILLWAAANDATEIVSACMGSGSVRALALAFDCADQAKIIEPAARKLLEDLLAPPAPGEVVDPNRQQLLAGIQAARLLRETIPLSDTSDTTALCARPVPWALYDLFVRAEQAAGRSHRRVDLAAEETERPALGIQAGDADRFVGWLNTVATDGSVYRLPTRTELADPGAAMAADLSRHTVWVNDTGHTRLHQPPRVPWPYLPSRADIASTPGGDLATTHLLLKLLLTPAPHRTHAVAWTRVLTTAFADAEAPPGLNRAHYDVLLRLAHARALDYARDRARALSSALNRARNRARAVRLARARVLALCRALERALALSSALDRRKIGSASLTDPLGRALTHALAVAGALADTDLRALADARLPAEARSLGDALVRARPPLAEDLDRIHRLEEDLEAALSEVLAAVITLRQLDILTVIALAEGGRRSSAIADALIGSLGSATGTLGLGELPGAWSRARLNERQLAEVKRAVHPSEADELDLALDRDQVHALDLALDLALDFCRDPGADYRTCAPILSIGQGAFHVLLTTWWPGSDEGVEGLAGLTDFVVRSMDVLPAKEDTGQRPPEDPADLVGEVSKLLRSEHLFVLDPLGAVQELVNLTARRLAEVLDRTAPADAFNLACARLALVAAAAALTGRDHDAAQRLSLAWRSLIALENQIAGRPDPNQILLLVRTQQ